MDIFCRFRAVWKCATITNLTLGVSKMRPLSLLCYNLTGTKVLAMVLLEQIDMKMQWQQICKWTSRNCPVKYIYRYYFYLFHPMQSDKYQRVFFEFCEFQLTRESCYEQFSSIKWILLTHADLKWISVRYHWPFLWQFQEPWIVGFGITLNQKSVQSRGSQEEMWIRVALQYMSFLGS